MEQFFAMLEEFCVIFPIKLDVGHQNILVNLKI
jgi:hypothetical protein